VNRTGCLRVLFLLLSIFAASGRAKTPPPAEPVTITFAYPDSEVEREETPALLDDPLATRDAQGCVAAILPLVEGGGGGRGCSSLSAGSPRVLYADRLGEVIPGGAIKVEDLVRLVDRRESEQSDLNQTNPWYNITGAFATRQDIR
jgi:hypothetical protein